MADPCRSLPLPRHTEAPAAALAAAPLLLTAPQAARALAVSARTLWALTDAGAVRCVRIGRAVRYAPEDLAAYVASLRQEVPQ